MSKYKTSVPQRLQSEKATHETEENNCQLCKWWEFHILYKELYVCELLSTILLSFLEQKFNFALGKLHTLLIAFLLGILNVAFQLAIKRSNPMCQ